MTLKVLVAEDSADVAEIVVFGVRMTWPDCEVFTAENGTAALQCFTEHQPDIVILDVTMPPPDGFEVCRRIRESSNVPILMLTVRDSTLDKVRGLDLGADDYLTKPFDHLELLARLRALVRRANSSQQSFNTTFAIDSLILDFATHEVTIADARVPLTSTEYRLLETLVQNAGTVLPHELLLEQVWGPEYIHDTHYLKVFIRRLRQKLGDTADNPRYIQTEWGIGYRFVAPHA